MMILRGVTLFPYYDLGCKGGGGGCGKFPTKLTSSIGRASHIKKTQDCLMLSKS